MRAWDKRETSNSGYTKYAYTHIPTMYMPREETEAKGPTDTRHREKRVIRRQRFAKAEGPVAKAEHPDGHHQGGEEYVPYIDGRHEGCGPTCLFGRCEGTYCPACNEIRTLMALSHSLTLTLILTFLLTSPSHRALPFSAHVSPPNFDSSHEAAAACQASIKCSAVTHPIVAHIDMSKCLLHPVFSPGRLSPADRWPRPRR
ncbi:hypothetical protein LY78DRAFT_276555 [Colletotrichum sublineola]|nr:hypothetical protein LY78DRAFT_276555 [Colletotrichum sublineola]